MKTRTWGNASRLTGRLLIFVFVVMLVGALGANATPVMTLVQDTLYRADGSAAHANITIRWSGFSTSAGEAVAAGEMTVVTDANGGISIPLIPNAGATPAGGYYKVLIKQDDGTTSEEQWLVGAGTTTTLSAIRAKVVPQSVAAQFVSREYLTDQLDGLATVASTGSYNDLTNKPEAVNLAAPGAIGGTAPGPVNATAVTADTLEAGTTFIAGDGLQPVNVAEKGALGNGTTDDTTAIAAAFTAAHMLGQCVYFPGGTYLISSTIQFSANNNCAYADPGATVVINATFSGPMFQLGTFNATPSTPYNDAAQGFTLKNITLENSAQISASFTGSRTTIGIQDNGSGGVELTDVTFHGLKYGFLGAYASDFDRFISDVGGNNDVSIYLGPNSQQFVIENFQTGVDGEGIVIAGAGQGKIDSSAFGDFMTSAITFECVYPTRTGYTLAGIDDLSITVSNSWFESGAGWTLPWQEPRQILLKSNTGCAGGGGTNTTYPRHVRFSDNFFSMGESGLPAMDSTQHSLLEMDSGEFITFENTIAQGDRYNSVVNVEGGARVLVHNYKSVDGYPQTIPPFYLGAGVNAYNGYLFQNDPNFGAPTSTILGLIVPPPATPAVNYAQLYGQTSDGRLYYMGADGVAHQVLNSDDIGFPLKSKTIVGTNAAGQLYDASGVTLANNTTGNAATASALSVTPTQCSGSQFATGVAANGNANCATSNGGAVSSLTVTGTSGAATLSGGVLNIPQYSGGAAASNDSTLGGASPSSMVPPTQSATQLYVAAHAASASETAYTPAGAGAIGAQRNGAIIEYLFDEGGGQSVVNHAFPQAVTPNYLGCYISAAACFGSAYWTAAYVADSPYGNLYTSDRLQLPAGNTYTNIAVGPSVAAGTYVYSGWLKGTSASQTFRLGLGPGPTYTSVQTATTSWQQFTETITVSAGGIPYVLIATDGTNAADLEVFLPQLNSGTQPLPFNQRQFDLVLGPDGGTENDPTWNAYGVNTQGGKYYLTAMTSRARTLTNATVYAVVKSTGAEYLAGYSPIFTNQSTSEPGSFSLTGNETGSGPTFIFGGTKAPLSPSGSNKNPTDVIDGNWHFIAATYNGTSVDLQVDGLDLGPAALASGSTTLSQLWLSLDNAVAYWPGNIAYFAVYETAHTQAQQYAKWDEVANLLAPRGITFPVNRVVICEGDSITDMGTAANGGYCFINGHSQLYTYPVVSVDNAIAGGGLGTQGVNTTGNYLTAREASDSAQFASWRTRNILSILIGANDLSTISAATEYANLQSYIAAMRVLTPGLKVVCSTVTPQSSSTFNTNRDAFNTLMYANHSFCDALADYAGNSTIGTDAAGSNTTYYPDGEHPSAAGQAIMAPIHLAAVDSVE